MVEKEFMYIWQDPYSEKFIISQFIHTMQSIGIPDDILTKINRELFAFIWKKRNMTTKKPLKR